jgi:hypothetical protein
MAMKPATITILQGKSSFRMGPPPVPGKAVTAGKAVCFGGFFVAVAVSVAPGSVAVAVNVAGVAEAGVTEGGVAEGGVAEGGVAEGGVGEGGVGEGGVGEGGVGEGGVGEGAARQVGPVMVLPSVVKELFSDMIRPSTVAPETRVISRDAMRVPTNVLPEAMTASRPICQNTWQGCALPAMTTEPENVMSRPTWKTQTSL